VMRRRSTWTLPPPPTAGTSRSATGLRPREPST
jgi:hypothetical protein